jgi:BspA type Leucine rich repeat region (6 copies)
MKTRALKIFTSTKLLPLLLLLALPAVAQAQYSYTDTHGTIWSYTPNNGPVTITGASGVGGAVTVPSSINGYPVTNIEAYAFNGYDYPQYEYFFSSVSIPASITSIGDFAFYDCVSLTNVTIPNGVTSIGYAAFDSCDLTSVTIPDSVTNLGQDAFENCYDLTSATIGNSVTSIALGTFNYCESLKSVTIGNSVTSIGDGAFYYCPLLTSMTIPDSVTNIGIYAFEYCYDLRQMLFLGNAPTVDGGAGSADTTVYRYAGVGTAYYLPGATGWGATFGGWTTAELITPATDFTCTTNSGAITITGYTGQDGYVNIPGTLNGYPVTAIGDDAFYNHTTLTAVIIPDSITSLGNDAFYDCYDLTSVTIGNSVTSIGVYAFYYCYSLASVTIPASVTSIGSYAFEDCSSLQQAHFQGNAPSVNGGAGSADTTVFYGDSGTAYYLSGTTGWGTTFGGWPTTGQIIPPPPFTWTTNYDNTITITGYTGSGGAVTIPDTITGYPVTTIGYDAFANNNNLTSVTIPDGVTSIQDYAFYSCNLDSITIGTNVTSIGNYAFADDNYLTGVTIPDSVTNIGNYAFGGIGVLTTVTIPDSVTSIGDEPNAFTASQVTAFTVDPSNAFYSSVGGVLFDKAKTTLVEYPGGLGGAYTISNSVTSIGPYAFGNCDLTNVTIGTNVTSIGDYAFEGSQVTSITIPASVTNIQYQAFDYCLKQTSITVDTNNPAYSSVDGILFDKSQTTLIQYPADKAGASYTIPASVTSVMEFAVSQCANLTSITIPNSVTSIQDYAFYGCTSLTNVTIGTSVTSLGSYAFFYCTKLTGVYFQGNSPIPNNDTSVFYLDNTGIVYYLPGTTGWGATFGGWPTAQWYQPQPQILSSDNGLGVQSSGFGFTISWATNTSVVVEAATNLANPVWVPVSTNTLTGGTSSFSDPQWTNYPGRYYRISSQ